MAKNESTRRKFLKLSSIGIGALPLSSFDGAPERKSELKTGTQQAVKKLNIVCLGAHPGDPEFGCGGTLAKLSDAGHNVSILYLTRGEAGDPAKSFKESAALRTAEAQAASKILKAKAIFAGQIDANTELNKASIEHIAGLILAEKPDILFTHWPLDTHPDHQVAGLLALNAWAQSGQQSQLYYYEVNTGSETMHFTPTDYVDISDVRSRKKAAMYSHKTQNPEEVYTKFFKAMEEFRGLEAGVDAAEGFILFKEKSKRAHIIGL